MTRGETLLRRDLKREMGSTEPIIEEKIENFDKEQLELLLNDLQDIDKFTGFKNGAFKYELGKYQASLLVNYIKKQKEVIDKAIEYITSAIENDDIEELKSARHLMLWNEDLDKLLEILDKEEVN